MYNFLTSFTLAALWLFIPSVPLTHGLGLVAHRPKQGTAKHLLLYPVKGGKHHFIFQIISWVSCTVTVCSTQSGWLAGL